MTSKWLLLIAYLPGYPTESEQKKVVCVRPVGPLIDGSHPVLGVEGDGLNCLMGPGKRNADDKANKDAAQLDHISVGHRVEASDPGVEHSNQGTTDHCCVKLKSNKAGFHCTASKNLK